ncbi:CoA transferase [Parahaliea maris]|uniref:CoA transferase n=1 Tax=Parahaliea maris TaxID=2716870 RepID=UPI00164F39FE|nr:CoA transferase [Parahaliea maris]
MRQIGIVAEDLLAERPGLTWVSLTGHGRSDPCGQWIAFGDDAGIAAGLSAILHQCTGRWMICGDAVADPMTGLHCALAGWASWLAGGGQLVDISLAAVVRHCVTATAPQGIHYSDRQRAWEHRLSGRPTRPGTAESACGYALREGLSSPP